MILHQESAKNNVPLSRTPSSGHDLRTIHDLLCVPQMGPWRASNRYGRIAVGSTVDSSGLSEGDFHGYAHKETVSGRGVQDCSWRGH